MRQEFREPFPHHRLQRKSHHVMRQGTARAVIRVGITNPRWPAKTFPTFPAHAQPAILRIWQEAHWHLIPLFNLAKRNIIATLPDIFSVKSRLNWLGNFLPFRGHNCVRRGTFLIFGFPVPDWWETVTRSVVFCRHFGSVFTKNEITILTTFSSFCAPILVIYKNVQCS